MGRPTRSELREEKGTEKGGRRTDEFHARMIMSMLLDQPLPFRQAIVVGCSNSGVVVGMIVAMAMVVRMRVLMFYRSGSRGERRRREEGHHPY